MDSEILASLWAAVKFPLLLKVDKLRSRMKVALGLRGPGSSCGSAVKYLCDFRQALSNPNTVGSPYGLVSERIHILKMQCNGKCNLNLYWELEREDQARNSPT